MNSQKYGIPVKIAVLCIIMVQYTITLTTPILGEIRENYPGGEYEIWIKLIETAPTLAMIPVCLLMGPLLKKFRKKILLLAGTFLACGQCLPLFADGFPAILAGRLISGLGMGICYPFAGSYILDLFKGRECDAMMGWRATVGAAGGVFIMQASGILAEMYHYRASFGVSLICLPLLLVMFLFIPDRDPAEENGPDRCQDPVKHESGAGIRGQGSIHDGRMDRPDGTGKISSRGVGRHSRQRGNDDFRLYLYDEYLHRHLRCRGTGRTGSVGGGSVRCSYCHVGCNGSFRVDLRQSICESFPYFYHGIRTVYDRRRHPFFLFCPFHGSHVSGGGSLRNRISGV